MDYSHAPRGRSSLGLLNLPRLRAGPFLVLATQQRSEGNGSGCPQAADGPTTSRRGANTPVGRMALEGSGVVPKQGSGTRELLDPFASG
jgi:hypothetical protein